MGNIQFRYQPGKNIIKYNLANVSRMSYGDFQDKHFQKNFYSQNSKRELSFVVTFNTDPIILECVSTKQLIDWFTNLRNVVAKYNPSAVLLNENLFLIRLSKFKII